MSNWACTAVWTEEASAAVLPLAEPVLLVLWDLRMVRVADWATLSIMWSPLLLLLLPDEWWGAGVVEKKRKREIVATEAAEVGVVVVRRSGRARLRTTLLVDLSVDDIFLVFCLVQMLAFLRGLFEIFMMIWSLVKLLKKIPHTKIPYQRESEERKKKRR